MKEDQIDDEIAAAAQTLHDEWDSPALWPAIAARIREARGTPPRRSGRPSREPTPVRSAAWSMPWSMAAVAAALLVAVAVATVWRSIETAPVIDSLASPRLLNDATLAEIERAEQDYVRAIDELARQAAPRLEMPDSPVIEGLRERLAAVDTAISLHRAEIAGNPFNAHLRQQLLGMYREKQRTLEEVQTYDDVL